ncbi:MAG: tetratricopeptide repeat protein [Desulfotalea sp.]
MKTTIQWQEISAQIDDLFGCGKKEEGLELLESAINAVKDNPSYTAFFTAEKTSYLGDINKAYEILSKAEHLFKKDNFLIRGLGIYLSNLGREEEAIEQYNKALETNPNNHKSLHGKGVSLSKLNRQEEAIEQYNKALEINPDDYHSLRQKGVSLSELDRAEEAIEQFNMALEINPDDYKSLRQKGVALSNLNREEEAIEQFNMALEINPDDYASLRQKGVSLSELERAEEAIEQYNKALKINPDDYYSLRQKGVSLSKLNREEEAFEQYNKALEINPDDYHSLRQKGVSLSNLNREEEAFEQYNKALEINPDDYHSLRNKGVSLSNLDREEEAIEQFNKALEVNHDDYHSLRNKGVSLSNLNREEEAIEQFNKALEINYDDYNSLRQKGVSLSNLNREEEAIEQYNKVLEIKPDDYDSLRQKGVSFSNLNREEEAIEQYNKALEINPDDYASLRNKGVSLYNQDLKLEALTCIAKAKEKQPGSKLFINDYEFIYSKLSTEDKDKLGPQFEIPDTRKTSGLMGFIETVREEFKDNIVAFETQKKKNEAHLTEFINSSTKLPENGSFFLVLRRWNSFTPALPLEDGEKSLGGGYFIYHKGKGTVIDPGYNFIENFQKSGCRLIDIDNIIITHAHNDHTIDFESLLTLLYQASKDSKRPKKVNLYLNQGSMLKFASLINWRGMKYVNDIFTINKGDSYTLSDGSSQMTILPAYHDEQITKNHSVGLHFSFLFAEDEKRNILLTSDTGLYPADSIGEDDKIEICELYKQQSENIVKDIDLLIPHLGSIGDKELSREIENFQQPQDVLYGNHLGVLGVLRVTAAINPKLSVVSEFGEELRGFRKDLCDLMQKVMDKVTDVSEEKERIPLLPADLPLIYNIKDRTVFCADIVEMAPVSTVKYEEDDGIFYYYSDEAEKNKRGSIGRQFLNIEKEKIWATFEEKP